MKKYIVYPCSEVLSAELTAMGLELEPLAKGTAVTNMRKLPVETKRAALKVIDSKRSGLYDGVIKPAAGILDFFG